MKSIENKDINAKKKQSTGAKAGAKTNKNKKRKAEDISKSM